MIAVTKMNCNRDTGQYIRYKFCRAVLIAIIIFLIGMEL